MKGPNTEMPEKPTQPAWLKQLPAAFGLIPLCALAYWPLTQAGYIWDDNVWLTDNPLAQHWNGLWYIWFAPLTSTQYYPIVYTAFLLQFKLWGLNPLGYHLVNIVLQAINAILLWRILRVLGLKSAWIVAAIFAIHPIQVETVGWITEQKNLLSAAFGLSAAFLWIRWAGLDVTGKMPVPQGSTQAEGLSYNPGGWKLLFPATILFVLALLSKTDICILPVVLLLVAWWKNGRLRGREILSLIPWLFIGGILAGITIYIEHGTAEATGPAFAFSLNQRVIIAGKDFWFYPFKLLWPYPLLAVYPRWDIDHIQAWDYLFPFTALLVLLGLWILRRKTGRGPFAAIAYYGIAIFPVLGFTSFYTMIYTFVADHYQYLAGIGIIVLVVELAANGWERFRAYLKKMETEKQTTGLMLLGGRALPIIAAGAVLLELGTLTWGQSELYREPEDIWQYALNYDPHSWFAAEQVGLCELQAKDADGAEKYEELAYTLTNGNNFLTDANLGYLYITKYNNYPAAISLLEKSVKLNPYQAYNIYSLATFYEKLGEMDKAKTLLDYGMKLMPREPLLHRTMGEYDARIGQIDAAIEEFRTALSYKPDDLDVMYELAFILAKTGHQNDAIDVCQQALGIDPEAANIIQLYKSLMAQNQPEPVLQ